MHSEATACHPSCLARTYGKRAQIAALQGLFDRGAEQAFWLQKTIDGLPGVNASTQLAGARVFYFAMRQHGLGRSLYEFTSGVDEFIRQLNVWGQHYSAHFPVHTLDSFALVFEVFEGAHSAASGEIREPEPGEKSLGLHSVAVSGYRDGGEIVRFANSWGAGWGDHGYGSVSRSYLEKYFHEALTRRPAKYGASLDKPALRDSPFESRRFRHAWLLNNPTWSAPLRGPYGNWRGILYESISPEYGCVVECISVHNGYGLRLGWAFVYHRDDESGNPISEIRELFCWPAFRRLGIGGYLEQTATERAASYGSGAIRLFMNEADAIIGPPRAAARLFGKQRGYEWRWRPTSGPRLAAIGIKRLPGSA
jgi:GNAT superfamily N-acetyltransferase